MFIRRPQVSGIEKLKIGDVWVTNPELPLDFTSLEPHFHLWQPHLSAVQNATAKAFLPEKASTWNGKQDIYAVYALNTSEHQIMQAALHDSKWSKGDVCKCWESHEESNGLLSSGFINVYFLGASLIFRQT